MVSKIYSGDWKNINGLKLHNGTSWKNAVRAFVHNGTNWKQWYPEYPLNTAAPTVSGTATQGNTLSCTTGSWNSNLAYAPTGYTYQWRRASSDISGATNSTYSTVLADVGNAISCRVTASNNRGTTPVISSNSITVTSALPGAPSNLSLTDSTVTPGTFSVSTSSSATTTASGSWDAATNTTSYSASTSVGTISANTTNRTYSISGGSSGTGYTVTVTAFNTSGIVSLSWSAGSGATSYDIYVNGSYWTNVTGTSTTYNWGSTGNISFNVRSRNATGAETTGVTNSINITTKSRSSSVNGSFYAVIPSISNVSYSSLTDNSVTISWNSTNQNSYSISGVGSWSGTTATSRAITGLSASTSYTATVTVTSSTGQTAQGSTSFTTPAAPIIPTISSFVLQAANPNTLVEINGSTTQSLYAVWSSTNQSTYSLSVSPAPSGGSSYSGTNATFRYLGLGDRGTTYSATLTVTSSTSNSTSSSASRTVPQQAVAPSAPSIASWVFSAGPSWSGSFNGSTTGTTPITYYYEFYAAQNSSGTNATYVSGGNTSSSSTGGTFNVGPFNNGGTGYVWGQLRVYAQNSAGTSTTTSSSWQ